ncbi:hypothetical protein J6TS1_26740 [Siminovitchia terrae]|uniref:RidA family protein n=1 Tax=Siminovitchia terrae TaxID=1914933 RepID=A0A429X4U5_SIMTE|nr:RidA family protein [Siminovitchia terrae]RST58399.1 RidA family protein [Siminovitchia terrae]GIN93993.1 hypothetical protein J22TS1_50440 [Siminovitchia terrae]GIN96804.1 hypothetical protein J6TS1_26740 [Siminovitchia terrae]
MSIEERLQELNITLPELNDDAMPYALGVVSGRTVILSGQTPRVNGEQRYIGTLGTPSINIEEAQDAAKICIINLLGALKKLVGDLDQVERIVKINGYVATTNDFTEHKKVINAASVLLNDIFGEVRKHARIAIGLASLPGGAPVEIEMTVELKE